MMSIVVSPSPYEDNEVVPWCYFISRAQVGDSRVCEGTLEIDDENSFLE